MNINFTNESKKTSRNSIYRLIFEQERISKPEIAHMLKLSLPTVIQNVKELIADGLIYENGALESNGGRKAVALSCKADARLAVGMDITKKHITAVIINLKGEILGQSRIKKDFAPNQEYYKTLGDIVKMLSANYNERILGVGISMPGFPSDDGSVLEYSHILRLRNEKCETMSYFIPYPAIFCNDANAAGIAELWVNPNIKDAVYLSISNSIGGAVFIDGKLYPGQNQRAGEIGHMSLIKDGDAKCYCGKRGCLDAYCSINALLEEEDGNLDEFFSALKNGNEKQVLKWSEYLENLSAGINNVRMLFDGDVIIGGYLGSHIGDYINILREKGANRNTFENNGAYIKPCCFNLSAAAVGASLIFVHDFINEL